MDAPQSSVKKTGTPSAIPGEKVYERKKETMVQLVVFVNLFFVPLLPLYILYRKRKKPLEPDLDLLFQYGIIVVCNIPLTKVFIFLVNKIGGMFVSMDSGYYTVAALLPTILAVSLYRVYAARDHWKKNIQKETVCVGEESCSSTYTEKEFHRQREKQLDIIALLCIFIFTIIIYSTHWKFELPVHPHADEPIVTNNVKTMLNGSIFSSLPFNYPHLAVYFGYFAYKIVDLFVNIEDIYYFIRTIICGAALLSNICVYFVGKRITGKKRYGYICLLISLFSSYQFQYLWYAGPDAMLYAVSNVIFLVAIEMYYLKDETKALKLYPVIAVLIGLAISAKYHGVLLGALWLSVHIAKGYYKELKKNKAFLGNCFLIIVSFLVCNWKIFLQPQEFINGFVFNFTHYAGRHVGIEHNIPLLGYVEAWVFYGFGFLGAVIFVFGIIYCFRHQEFKSLAVVLLVAPIIVLFVLSRSVIMLGRNIALIMPVFYIFEMFGFFAIEDELVHKPRAGAAIPTALIVLMVTANIYGMIYIDNFRDSYDYIEKWIPENIERGSTIYVSSYNPIVDKEMYNIQSCGNGVPDLKEGEYYIASGYSLDRFFQRKDYYFFQGDYMYPDSAESYTAALNKLQLVHSAQTVCSNNFRLKFSDFFTKKHDSYFKGPTINIYERK